jgi:hypothetical protein
MARIKSQSGVLDLSSRNTTRRKDLILRYKLSLLNPAGRMKIDFPFIIGGRNDFAECADLRDYEDADDQRIPAV